MKKYFLVILTALLGLVSCGGDEPEPVAVSLSKSELTFTTDGGFQSITVKGASYDNVALPANGTWYTLTKVAADNTQCYVRVNVEPNESYDPRSAAITLTCAGQSLVLNISQEAVPEPVVTDAMNLGKEMGFGWNLGNQLDAVNTWSYGTAVSEETAWGNPVATQATFTGLAAKGIKTVRIPVTWAGHVGEAPNYTIDETWMNRVAEVVGYAKAAGLKAIINIHHDEGAGEGHYGFLDIRTVAYDAAKNENVKAQLSAMWKQIATKFKNEGDYLIFETMNEVQDGKWGWGTNKTDGGKQYKCLNEWQQVAVDAIRSVGGQNANRWIAVVGYAQNPQLTMDNLVIPTDKQNRIIVAVHCYEPSKFTNGESKTSIDNEWGHTSSLYKNGETTILNLIENLRKKYIDQNIPCYIGEFSCVNRDGDRARQFQKYYLEYFSRACYLNGISPIIWDNGATTRGYESHGFIQHDNGEWAQYSADFMPTVINAMNSADETYTLESIYNNAPK